MVPVSVSRLGRREPVRRLPVQKPLGAMPGPRPILMLLETSTFGSIRLHRRIGHGTLRACYTIREHPGVCAKIVRPDLSPLRRLRAPSSDDAPTWWKPGRTDGYLPRSSRTSIRSWRPNRSLW